MILHLIQYTYAAYASSVWGSADGNKRSLRITIFLCVCFQLCLPTLYLPTSLLRFSFYLILLTSLRINIFLSFTQHPSVSHSVSLYLCPLHVCLVMVCLWPCLCSTLLCAFLHLLFLLSFALISSWPWLSSVSQVGKSQTTSTNEREQTKRPQRHGREKALLLMNCRNAKCRCHFGRKIKLLVLLTFKMHYPSQTI